MRWLTNPITPRPATSGEARLRRLKLVQEFVVKPCLKSVKGVADINTTGGYDQVMVVEVDPLKLPNIGYDMNDIAVLMARDVAVGGGALVERDGNQFIIRSRSRAQTSNELANCCLKLPWVLRAQPLSTVASINLGSKIRLGAATLNGEEAVLGTAMMLTGENAHAVARSFNQALAEAQSRLPSEMELKPLYNRAELVDGVIDTVGHNLALAAGLVIAGVAPVPAQLAGGFDCRQRAAPVVCPGSGRHGDVRHHGQLADARSDGFRRGGGRYHRYGGKCRAKTGRSFWRWHARQSGIAAGYHR